MCRIGRRAGCHGPGPVDDNLMWTALNGECVVGVQDVLQSGWVENNEPTLLVVREKLGMRFKIFFWGGGRGGGGGCRGCRTPEERKHCPRPCGPESGIHHSSPGRCRARHSASLLEDAERTAQHPGFGSSWIRVSAPWILSFLKEKTAQRPGFGRETILRPACRRTPPTSVQASWSKAGKPQPTPHRRQPLEARSTARAGWAGTAAASDRTGPVSVSPRNEGRFGDSNGVSGIRTEFRGFERSTPDGGPWAAPLRAPHTPGPTREQRPQSAIGDVCRW